MKIKKILSYALASLVSLNAFSLTPSVSFAGNSAVEKNTCCEDKETKAEIEKLKAEIKSFESKIKELEKNSKSQKTCVTVPTYDKKINGFLNILDHLMGTTVASVCTALTSVILSAVTLPADVSLIAIGIIAVVSGLTVFSVKSWIHYLQGYVS